MSCHWPCLLLLNGRGEYHSVYYCVHQLLVALLLILRSLVFGVRSNVCMFRAHLCVCVKTFCTPFVRHFVSVKASFHPQVDVLLLLLLLFLFSVTFHSVWAFAARLCVTCSDLIFSLWTKCPRSLQNSLDSFYLKIIKFLCKDMNKSLFCHISLHCYVIIGLLKLNTYNMLFEIYN